MDKPSEMLTDANRYLFRSKAIVENYERENGRFANTANTTDIKTAIDKIIPVVEREIDVAKKYEYWVEGTNKPVYLLRRVRWSSHGNVVESKITNVFKTWKRADAYRLSLPQEKRVEYHIEEWLVE